MNYITTYLVKKADKLKRGTEARMFIRRNCILMETNGLALTEEKRKKIPFLVYKLSRPYSSIEKEHGSEWTKKYDLHLSTIDGLT